jgi:glycosyltransferase involved in cell wall biosynthesis
VFDIIPRLQESGIQCEVFEPRPLGKGLGRLYDRFREHREILGMAAEFDVVYIQKRLFDSGFIAKLKTTCPKIIFDMDDSIFTSPKGDWSASTRKKVHGRLGAVMSAADVVTVGNLFLKEKAAGYGASNIEIVPTAIDISRYGLKKHTDHDTVTLGWIGSAVNHPYLDTLSGVFEKLAARHEDIRLLVVSDMDYRSDGIDVVNRRWSEQTEVADILDMDIGLMPLSDDEWTRGKCALKALQYMSAGIPAVCSPVGANMEAVTDGVEGFLPRNDEEWVDRLSELVLSSGLRNELGTAGREKVLAGYDLASIARRAADIILWNKVSYR